MRPAAATSKPGIFINRNYGLLFIGQVISLIGDQIFTLTIALWIATNIAQEQVWAPVAVYAVFALSADAL
jgi:hypothetical protein